jgi:hypothetical protein
MGRESANSKNNSAVFPELVPKSLPERENGGQIGEIGVYVLWSFRFGGTITGWIKTPFLPHFHILLHYIHIVGDLPSKRVCGPIFFKRLFAVFSRNNDILGFIPKPCAGIHNFVQSGMTISSKRGNPGPYWAPFCSGYLLSGMLINTSNTTSNFRRSGVHIVPNQGTI